MRAHYIEEKGVEMTYIELRLLLPMDCDLKYRKITEILEYLHRHFFIADLTMLYQEGMSADNLYEKPNVMSLTVDMVNDKIRFKFWNGASVLWLYHVSDVCDALDTGREKFSKIYDKYEPVTEVLMNFKSRWTTSIYHISYQYYPDEEIEVVYHIVFTEEVKNADFTNILIEKIHKEILMLGKDFVKDLNFRIEHSFKTSTCTPCEQARKEREALENE